MSVKHFSDKSGVELLGDDRKIALFRISVWANHMEEPNKFDAKWDLTAAEYASMGPAWTQSKRRKPNHDPTVWPWLPHPHWGGCARRHSGGHRLQGKQTGLEPD
jgi:hypothetical protein